MQARLPKFPNVVKVAGISGISATIYQQIRTKPDKDGTPKSYVSFIVSYSMLGKRRLESAKSYEVAVEKAEAAVKKIANGEQAALQLTNGHAVIYQRSREVADKLGLEIDQICQRFAALMDTLGATGTPEEACAAWAKTHNSIKAKTTVGVAAKEMIEQEEKAAKTAQEKNPKRKKAWVKLLKAHIENKFADHFKDVPAHTIDSTHINPWFDSLSGSERTKRNIKDTVTYFFKWARGRGYIPKDADPMAYVTDFKKRKLGKIEILTPDDLKLLLKAADSELVPYLALRAFAGLRDSEAAAIDWKHVDLEGGWVEVTEEVAKQKDDENGVRRLIPVRPCLKAWLKDHVEKEGKVYPHEFTSKQLAALCTKAGVTWKRNCLRHSYISYAIAESNDLEKVAFQSGNSPAIIKQHYLQVVKPDAAKAWFGILPG